MYPPNVLEAKAKEAAGDARNALIMAVIGVFCFGFGILLIAIGLVTMRSFFLPKWQNAPTSTDGAKQVEAGEWPAK